MSDVFFSDLDIAAPTWLLGVGSGTHAVQTGTAMMRLEELFSAERPDAVLVVGDVNSTLAGALAAAKLQIPVVHLEAGLRSGDMSMPEEVNRLVTDQLSAMLLAPTEDALANLAREGVERARVHFVGNIMAEALLRNVERVRDRVVLPRPRPRGRGVRARHDPPPREHGPPREARARRRGAPREAPLPVLMPVHPRTRPLLAAAGLAGEDPPRAARRSGRLPGHARAAARRGRHRDGLAAASRKSRACSTRRA